MPTTHSVLRNSGPLVTVAIPTFNRASLLKDCLNSAFSQTYENYEVVVSDNASTDGTSDLLELLSHPTLRVVRQQTNIGLIPNWNACLAEAKGDYVLFLSDDDRIEPEMLERCVALTRIESQLPIIVALCEEQDTWGHIVRGVTFSKIFCTGVWQGSDILIEYLRWRISTQMCTILLRTDEVRALGGFPTDMPHACDMVIVASLLLKGRSGFVNECCGTYGIHNSRETSRLTVDHRVDDARKLAGVIKEMAKERINDRRKVHQIQLFARRLFLTYAGYCLLEYCNGGVTFSEALSALWRWRAVLVPATLVHIQRKARRFAVEFLPEPVIRFARQLQRP